MSDDIFLHHHIDALKNIRDCLMKRAEKAEAERDRLRKALEFCLATGDKIIKRNHGMYLGDWEDLHTIRQCARNVLEETDND